MAKWWPFGRKAQPEPAPVAVNEPVPFTPLPPSIAVPPPDVPARRFCAVTRIGKLEWHSLCGLGSKGQPHARAAVVVKTGHWI